MKLLVTIATALAFATTLAATADAGPRKKKRAQSYSKYDHRHRHDDSIGGYYEHRLEALRFGSQRWWHVYQQQRGPRG